MKKLHFTEGGRMLHNDDLKILQEEVFKALEGQYKGLGAFIMSGCRVGEDDNEPGKFKINEGLVYLNGKFLEVDEAPNLVGFPKYIVEDLPEMRKSYPLSRGGTAPKRQLFKARVISENDFNEGSFSNPEAGRTEWIKITLEGGKSYFDALRGSFNALSIGHNTTNLEGHDTLDVLGSLKVSGPAAFGEEITLKDSSLLLGQYEGTYGRTLTIKTLYGNTIIGQQNASWSHFETDSENGFWFGSNITANQSLSVSGNITAVGTGNFGGDIIIDGEISVAMATLVESWDSISKGGFYTSSNAVDSPSSEVYFGISVPYVNNKNGFQIISSNSGNNSFYLRRRSSLGLGEWSKIVHSTGDHSIDGDLNVGSLRARGVINAERNNDNYGGWFGAEPREENPSINVGAWWDMRGAMRWDGANRKLKLETQYGDDEIYENGLVIYKDKIGVNQDNPTEALDVLGNINAQGVLYINTSNDEALQIKHLSSEGNPYLSFYLDGIRKSFYQITKDARVKIHNDEKANTLIIDGGISGLKFENTGSAYEVYHAGNSNLETVDWSTDRLITRGTADFGSSIDVRYNLSLGGQLNSLYTGDIMKYDGEGTKTFLFYNGSLRFFTGGGSALSINSDNGYIGIGNNMQSPEERLHVGGNIKATGSVEMAELRTNAIATKNEDLYIKTYVGDSDWARGIHFSDDLQTGGVNQRASYGLLGNSDDSFRYLYMAFGPNPWSSENGIYVCPDNKVGIQTKSPVEALDISGNIKVTGSAQFGGTIRTDISSSAVEVILAENTNGGFRFVPFNDGYDWIQSRQKMRLSGWGGDILEEFQLKSKLVTIDGSIQAKGTAEIKGATQGKLMLTNENVTGTTWNISSNIPSVSAGGLAIWSDLNGVDNGFVMNNGHVGINKTSPIEALDVVGNLKISGTGEFGGDITVNGNKVWYSGNDGSGSGLDADKLDGKEPSELSVLRVIDQGKVTAHDGAATTFLNSGIELVRAYSNGYPVSYGNVVRVGGGNGGGELLLEWKSNETTGSIFYRSKRDTTSTAWGGWEKLWHSGNDGSGSGLDADTVDGIQGNELMRAISDGSYYGMKSPDGSTSNWIRTTANGFIPYQSGGSSALGTSSWPFNLVYSNTYYEGGTALSSKYLGKTAKASDSDKVDGLHSSSFLRSDADDTLTGRLYPGSDSSLRAGMYGRYSQAASPGGSYKVGHIWSMGTSYLIEASGANFGNLYGFGYKHTNNTTGGTMAGGHMAVWCQNGNPYVALGNNLWVKNSVEIGGNLSVTWRHYRSGQFRPTSERKYHSNKRCLKGRQCNRWLFLHLER
ncbi:hypothetical protein [Xanthovirga aplysinae]|uniref:hypothetical protein n=1 Tax=Xanthovirga aplysinae TaxID=2529853 RepID=UPI001FE4ACD3|nr:hypothetical protein [Xanthovirga aplysinae]